MNFKKRYILLLVVAVLPLVKLIHIGDYCFGILDWLIIGGLSVLFFIIFLVTLFYNLYNISLKKEIFNFFPLVTACFLALALYVGYHYHEQPIFKQLKAVYTEETSENKPTQISLFTNKTFEFKSFFKEYHCIKKGTYEFKNKMLYFYLNDTVDVSLDTVYRIDQASKKIMPTSVKFKSFKKGK